MMASGEIRLSSTMLRQMPVLAQSQATQNQVANNGLQEPTAMAQDGSSNSPTAPLAEPSTSPGAAPPNWQTIEDDLANQQDALDNAAKAQASSEWGAYRYYMTQADFWMRQYFSHMGTPLNGSDYGQNPANP